MPGTEPAPLRGPRNGQLFVFRHIWRLAAAPDRVHAVLADGDRYADWWPQIRSVTPLSVDEGLVRARSLLPYTLSMRLRRLESDPDAGRLEVAITGDLTGWARWTLGPDVGVRGTRAAYAQEVVVTAPRLARFAPHTGPILRANHAWMMRSGERGLRRHLSRG